ncbi:hypothetical protein SDC9_199677 [bioreactor metagenome]|uniref:Uncharacterized protein n=1 Tax=bioreactor metagenome TaxID=1076179 RepID=A0A645IL33_9ZZZZ
MAGGVNDVDFGVLISDGGIFRNDGDSALALQIARIHHAVGHGLVGTEHAALLEQLVHESGLAVVHVGDDGDVPYIGSGFHIICS